jgi:rubredoxin
VALDALTPAQVEDAAYQMGYEGLSAAHAEHNPFPEGDERHVIFNEATLKGAEAAEADAEIVRVIVDGPRPESPYTCPDCGGGEITVEAWETQLVIRHLDGGEDLGGAVRRGDSYTDEVVSLHCEGCGGEGEGNDLEAWGVTDEPGERGDGGRSSLSASHCPACGSSAVDVTAWESELVTRRVDEKGPGAELDREGSSYVEGIVQLRCTTCGHEADAEQGDDVSEWREVTVQGVRSEVGRGWRVSTYDNWEPPEDDRYRQWDEALKAGRNYLVGSDVPLDEFVKSYRSPMRSWQQTAYRWAIQHPGRMLILRNASNSWEVYKRGEYVEFGLPHHDAGGVRHYISRNGKSKIRVNED